ncbi:MAG: molybdopterin cofactor-binding domain-containing protein [Steroidobacteraceae bacterium]
MLRREFVLLSGSAALALGAGLARTTLVAAATTALQRGADGAQRAARLPFAMLDILPTNDIVVRVAKSEMGQGVLTSLPMLVAEELGVELADVRVELAPGAAAFRDARGGQITGYSSSVSSSFLPLRAMGAAAREMLIIAAAQRLGVVPTALRVRGRTVVDDATGRAVPFADLLEFASMLPIPAAPRLTAPADYRLLGRALPRVDTGNKVDGSAQFGIDVRVPGARVAVLARPPTFGGSYQSFDDAAALAMPGVEKVVPLQSGVAVVARDFWSAKRGRDALAIAWQRGANGDRSSATHAAELDAALSKPGKLARAEGQVPDGQLFAAATTNQASDPVFAEYRLPFLAHAALEPLAATAHVQADRCEVWVGTQSPSRVQQWGAKLTGLSEDRIIVHTHTIGGAFGRRGEWDYYLEAIELSQRLAVPIKLMWTREDDMQHDFYRPANATRLAAGLAADGRIEWFAGRVAAPSINRRRSPAALERGVDQSLVEGLFDHLYSIGNQRIDYHEVELGVPVGYWRSVGHSSNVFVLESFIDELAQRAGVDPLTYRLNMLAGEPRMRGVLEAAAEAANWGRYAGEQRSAGRGQGLACAKSYGTYVAQVVDVAMTAAGLEIERVVCAVDCGQVVNPNIIEQQMHSGIIFGLTAALRGAITIAQGAVAQSNLHDYRLLGIHESPPIEVRIMASRASPGGCGEPSTPVIAPALANAIFAASGRRLRQLPLQPQLGGV